MPGPPDDTLTPEAKFWIPFAKPLHGLSRMRSPICPRRGDVFLVDDRI